MSINKSFPPKGKVFRSIGKISTNGISINSGANLDSSLQLYFSTDRVTYEAVGNVGDVVLLFNEPGNEMELNHQNYLKSIVEQNLFYLDDATSGGYTKNTRRVRKSKRKPRKTNRRKSMKR